MRVDLTDLQLFVNVHDSGTMTEGAARTHMTLAAASERVKGMEASVGVPLFRRGPKGVKATAAGNAFMQHARLVLRQVDRMQGELDEYKHGITGQVKMLCNTSALVEHLPERLATFLIAHPGVSLDLEERTSAKIVDAIRHESCEIGVVSNAIDLDGLESFHFCPDPLTLIAPATHPVAVETQVAFADVVDSSFVGLVGGSAFQDHVAQQTRRLGKQVNYRIRLRNFESVCRLVGLGVGLAVVPRSVARRWANSEGLKLIGLADGWADRQLMICVRNRESLTSIANKLLQHLLVKECPEASPKQKIGRPS